MLPEKGVRKKGAVLPFLALLEKSNLTIIFRAMLGERGVG
jgi:hypothetical protein